MVFDGRTDRSQVPEATVRRWRLHAGRQRHNPSLIPTGINDVMIVLVGLQRIARLNMAGYSLMSVSLYEHFVTGS